MDTKSKKKIYFMCVGFHKCGTTTLDGILRQYNELYLPRNIKEPFFPIWYKKYDNPMKILFNRFFPDWTPPKKMGMIDNTLSYLSAKELQKYFGADTKIIIMLRNPVNALFSSFKMKMRNGNEDIESFIKGDDLNDMFKNFLRDDMRHGGIQMGHFKYSSYLKDVYSHYKSENIMVIIFEDFISNPLKYKEKLEAFLEIRAEENVNYGIKMNEGNKISRNKFCFKLNRLLFNIPAGRVSQFPMVMKVFYRVSWKINKYTLVENNTRLSETLRKRCEKYYGEDVREVEGILNIKLDELWFA